MLSKINHEQVHSGSVRIAAVQSVTWKSLSLSTTPANWEQNPAEFIHSNQILLIIASDKKLHLYQIIILAYIILDLMILPQLEVYIPKLEKFTCLKNKLKNIKVKYLCCKLKWNAMMPLLLLNQPSNRNLSVSIQTCQCSISSWEGTKLLHLTKIIILIFNLYPLRRLFVFANVGEWM